MYVKDRIPKYKIDRVIGPWTQIHEPEFIDFFIFFIFEVHFWA